MASSLSPKAFYSQNKKSPNIKLLRKEKELKDLFLPISFRPSFADDFLYSVWKVFRCQKQALDYSKVKTGLHVFSFESNSFVDNLGQRLFLVTSLKEFWHYYIQLEDKMRLHYEVIRENVPCHLYFDIEFEYDLNPGKNGSAMIDTFVEYVCTCLRRSNIECSSRDFLILASNSPSKFSRHVIVRLPGGRAFRNNFEAGAFAKHICNSYKSNLGSSGGQEGTAADEGSSSSLFLIRDRSDKEDTFCDLAVYSKNRNFRLYLSSKRRKGYHLRLAPENRYPLSVGLRDGDDEKGKESKEAHREIFMNSLICNVGEKAELLVHRDGILLSYDESLQELDGKDPSACGTFVESIVTLTGLENTILPISRDRPSQLDDFVNSLIRIGGVEGKIYRKSLSCDGAFVVYDIVKNRWCRNVGRFHKNNNVRLVVDLNQRVWHQKCHDPDCKRINYRSPDFSIPPEVSLEGEAGPGRSREEARGESQGRSSAGVEGSALDLSPEVLMDLVNCELTEDDATAQCRMTCEPFDGDEAFSCDVTDDDILQVSLCEEM